MDDDTISVAWMRAIWHRDDTTPAVRRAIIRFLYALRYAPVVME